MNVTPFIRPINTQGGTFYTFSSASEDLGFTFNNDARQFKFSKYALLNIPNIARPTLGPLNYQNSIQLDAIPGAFTQVNNSKTYNLMLAESFENYALNLEVMLTAYPTYDPNKLQTVSERVFFKWLKEVGALRFREASASESPLTSGLRFTEEASSDKYSRVIQYIGEVDVMNSVKSSADSFSEIYVHVPTKDGATPLVLFKSLNDVNYFPGQNLINVPSDPLNTEYIYGRSYADNNPAGLVIKAFFDSKFPEYGATAGLPDSSIHTFENNEYVLFKYDTGSSQFLTNWWFSYPEGHSYWTQPPATTGSFDDPSNDSLAIKGIKNNNVGVIEEIYLQRSRLDGISLDFNINSYYPIASNPAIHSFSDFNSLPDTASFEFNAVLLYYDITNTTTGETATNLFGVLFLSDVQDTLDGGAYIPRLQKFKPNRITGLNGNSYGFKINLKFDVNTDDTAIVTAVNEYAPFSMQLFVDALNQLGSAADTLTSETAIVENLTNDVDSLKLLIYNSSDLKSLDSRISVIEDQLATSQANLQNSSTLMSLIQRNYNEILNIYNNKTSVSVVYNTDVLSQGEGISLDKSTPNQIVIKNVEQDYTIDANPVYDLVVDFTNTPSTWIKFVKLSRFANYFKISNGSALTVDRDISIFIDDSQLRWSNGQTFKVTIDHFYPLDMSSLGSFDLIVYTDALDKLNTGQTYNKEIARISSYDFYSKGGVPKIEIICLDKDTYNFTFDLI